MLPVDLLVEENRLIERIVKPTQKERERIMKTGNVDSNFIVKAGDFFRTYADQHHHKRVR